MPGRTGLQWLFRLSACVLFIFAFLISTRTGFDSGNAEAVAYAGLACLAAGSI